MAGGRYLTGSSGVRLCKLVPGGTRLYEHISGRRGFSSWSTTTAGHLRSRPRWSSPASLFSGEL
ncbi:hypothetical protein M6B38_208720 [Iris pallida]|uniref:Uncharacterized protein n=1 Tax=Iris pallida TaxID=29817 RepID=A0AAX6E525_IRIPA|nr:hypothetical protein M6B38_208720 [Iris pallida]